MSFRNVVLALTAVAILLIGYLLDHPVAGGKTQQVAIGPSTSGGKVKKTKAASRPPKAKGTSEAQEPLRDPFADPTPVVGRRSGSRLNELDLSELRLVAIVRDTEGRYGASVEDVSGKGFMLREGTSIGPTGAAVLRISQDEVVVAGGGPEQSLRLRPPPTPLGRGATAPRTGSGAAPVRSQGRR